MDSVSHPGHAGLPRDQALHPCGIDTAWIEQRPPVPLDLCHASVVLGRGNGQRNELTSLEGTTVALERDPLRSRSDRAKNRKHLRVTRDPTTDRVVEEVLGPRDALFVLSAFEERYSPAVVVVVAQSNGGRWGENEPHVPALRG